MLLNLFLFIQRYQLPFFDYKFAADNCKIHPDRLAENHGRNRVMQRSGVIQTVQIDCAEIGAFSGFQAADIGTPQHGCPAACGQFECNPGSH